MFDKENLRRELFTLRDEDYRDFQAKTVPTIPKKLFIGIRTPELVRFVKKYFHDDAGNSGELINEFLADLPHEYFEENSIHALLISEMKDFERCLAAVKIFLPHVDNWATCDSISPKIFGRHLSELDTEISTWLESERIFTVRFGLVMLMKFFLGKNFDVKYLERSAAVKSEDYYVQMAAAWFFATALATNFDETTKFLAEGKVSSRVYTKMMRKVMDSRKITEEQKNFLRGLRP